MWFWQTFVGTSAILVAFSAYAAEPSAHRARIGDCEARLTNPATKNQSNLKRYYLSGGTDFDFRIKRGKHEDNYFLRKGSNQSHTALTSGEHAQIVTAWPAGNSGVMLVPKQ